MLVPPAWMDCCCCILHASCCKVIKLHAGSADNVLTLIVRRLAPAARLNGMNEEYSLLTRANRTQSNKVAAFMFIVMIYDDSDEPPHLPYMAY